MLRPRLLDRPVADLELGFDSIPHRVAEPHVVGLFADELALCEHRHDGDASLGYRVEILVSRQIRVKDPIHAGPSRRAGGARATGVYGHAYVASVRLDDDGGEFFFGDRLGVSYESATLIMLTPRLH
jgi:hypothetical protein